METGAQSYEEWRPGAQCNRISGDRGHNIIGKVETKGEQCNRNSEDRGHTVIGGIDQGHSVNSVIGRVVTGGTM